MESYILLGERCSGTNVIEAVVRRNAGLVVSHVAGFKHFPKKLTPELADEMRRLPALLVVRHPISWLRSLYAQPWHAAPNLKSLGFSDFLRSEWMSVWDSEANIDPSDSRYGFEMLEDRDAETGQRFANVLRLRTGKLKLMLQTCVVAEAYKVVRLEDYIERPHAAVADICSVLGKPLVGEPRLIDDYKGNASWKRKLAGALVLGKVVNALRPRRGYRAKPQVSQDDAKFIWSELDHGLEESLGYSPGSMS